VLAGGDRLSLARAVSDRRPIEVACALIEREGRVLVARRSLAMTLGGKWEFPGGKLHDGESPRDALVREIAEELRVAVRVGAALPPSTHDYGEFAITLLPFLCTIASGEPDPTEHDAIAWCAPHELDALDWAAADVPVVAHYVASRPTKGIAS
jgi:8-oxo-dGTP diphosphatase